jgi:hypothetical protein
MTDRGDLKLVDPLKSTTSLTSPEKPTASAPVSRLKRPVTGDPVKDDFRVFLTLMWRQLGLPDPTELQLDLAWYLQHHGWNGEVDRLIIMAFRGAAKSFITAAYALWNLYCDHGLKIGVFSGSSRRAVSFVNFCLSLIAEWELLNHLRPGPKQRQSSTAFDVGPVTPDQTPSLFAAGITAAIVGFRAHIIVGDDVETNTNSMTPDMRQKLSDSVREFDAIILPGGQILFLGTPQTDSSVYNRLQERGYQIKIWPARYPTGKQMRSYGANLAPYIRWKLEQNPKLAGSSTEPGRFTDEELLERELSWGKAGFALQYMLDTSLTDVDKYPLRLGDLIVMALDPKRGPDTVSWGSGDHLVVKDVQPLCQDGDRCYGPSSISESFSEWQAVRAFIDPSGKGKDETSMTIVGLLHSRPYVLKQASFEDGYGPETLGTIASHLVEFNVSTCRVEEDFGQGMFAQLLKPVVKKAWEKKHKRDKTARLTTEIVSERAKKVRKELRILEILEPLFQSHRLVMGLQVLQEDYLSIKKRDGRDLQERYSLMYQITRLTREKDCLSRDDRVESLSGALSMFVDELGLNPDDMADVAMDERLEKLFQELMGVDEAYEDLRDHDKRGLRGKLRGI